MMIGQETAQERQMSLAPLRDALVVVAIRDRAADHQKQDLRQGMRHPPGLARILDDGEVVQKGAKTGLLPG
jgi:hypothetical protein